MGIERDGSRTTVSLEGEIETGGIQVFDGDPNYPLPAKETTYQGISVYLGIYYDPGFDAVEGLLDDFIFSKSVHLRFQSHITDDWFILTHTPGNWYLLEHDPANGGADAPGADGGVQ